MKNNMQNGVTLVALVVTIIILLILAGVTIGTVFGNNGLFEMVKQSVEKYKLSQQQEENDINSLEDLLINKPEIVVSNLDEWTKEKNITIHGIEKYKVRYTLDGTNPDIDNGIEYNDKIEINKNCTIKAIYIKDNKTYGKISEEKITKIDNKEPTDLKIKLTPYKTSIKVEIEEVKDAIEDEESGSSGIEGIRFSKDGNKWTEYTNEKEYTFKGLYGNLAGETYEIQVEAKDYAGNTKKVTQTETTTCRNNAYYSETANELICTINSREYRKVNNIGAIVSYAYADYNGVHPTMKGEVGPVLVSTDESAVSYYTSLGTVESMASFEYYGTVYYMTLLKHGYDNSPTVVETRFKPLNSSENRFIYMAEDTDIEFRTRIGKYFLDLYFGEN